MDNLTHSLAGAVLGQMGLKRKTGLAMPALIIGANIPDIDAVAIFLDGHQHLAMRRGITHGPIAMLILPLLLWAGLLCFDRWQGGRGKRPEKRPPIHKGWLLALAYIGCLSHPALDWLNSYGIRLLEPFSSQWFYGDSIFIIDIWIWLALIAGVWASLWRERKGAGNWQRPAWISFTAICAYIFANGLITNHAEIRGKSEFYAMANGGASVGTITKIVANPVPFRFWRREVIIQENNSWYSIVPFSLFGGLENERAHQAGMAIDQIKGFAEEFSRDPQVKNFLFWSRLPTVEIKAKECYAPCPFDEAKSTAARIGDARFSNDMVKDRFSVPIIFPPFADQKEK